MPDFLLNISDTPAWLVIAVIVSTFMLEDLAIIAAAMLAVSQKISPEIAFTAVCTGMLIGDTALYLFGRLANAWQKLGRWMNHPVIRHHTVPLQQAPWQQLVLMRCNRQSMRQIMRFRTGQQRQRFPADNYCANGLN